MVTRAALLPMVLLVSVWDIGCAPAKFSDGSASSGSEGASSCATQLGTTSAPVKLLFVVDTSGSNSDNGSFDGDSTDPTKSLRGGSIQKFFGDYASNPLFSWGFLTFSDNQVRNLTGVNFTNSATVMQTAINAFEASTDGGNTPYGAALGAVYSAIASDAASSSKTKYIVVFLSDGMPDPDIATSTLSADISAILGLKPGQVTFNTIYYGPEDPDASARLQGMATVGQGHFLDVNDSSAGKDFSIVNEITVPGSTCK